MGKRIHLVTDQFSVGGGIEHIYQIVKGFKDYQFSIFGNSGPAQDKFKLLKNVVLYTGGYKPSYVMSQPADLIHIHHLKPLLSFFRNSFFMRNLPIVFTAHGLHIHKFEFFNSLSARLSYFLRFQLEKQVMKMPVKTIAVSLEDQKFLEEKYSLNKVIYLTNGIDFSPVNRVKSELFLDIREELKISEQEFVFVTVARFNFQKGYDVLIRAISLIKDLLKTHKVRFIFIGDGPELNGIQTLSKQHDVSQYICYMGARDDIYRILRVANVCILPSRWEGLPIFLLEAGLLEVPVIASDTYGNREIIGDHNGLLFNNLDSQDLARVIRAVLTQKYNLKKYANNLFKEVQENYNLEKMLSKLRKIYESLGQKSEKERE